MAEIFLRSTDGDDGDDGSTWALAKATCAAALVASGAGGTVWMSKNHAEIQASLITLLASLPATPSRVICVDDTADPEPPIALATGGTIESTSLADINIDGCAYYHGVRFKSNDDFFLNNSITVENWNRFNFCIFEFSGTGSDRIFLNDESSLQGTKLIEMDNCAIVFASTGQRIIPRSGRSIIRGLSMSGSVPATLFRPQTTAGYWFVQLLGSDLSLIGSGKNLIDVSGNQSALLRFVDCKLGASVAVTTGSVPGQGGIETELINCDSGDTNTRYARSSYQGEETSETTVVLDASDGTTTFSRKMVSSANSKTESPMESLPITFWNETVGSEQTVTIEVVTDNVTLQDDEAWIEVEYLGTSGFPLGVFASDRLDDFIFGTPANQPTSSAAWVTTGLGAPVKQKLSVAFTAQQKGLIRVRVMLAKPSTTMYYNPKITLS